MLKNIFVFTIFIYIYLLYSHTYIYIHIYIHKYIYIYSPSVKLHDLTFALSSYLKVLASMEKNASAPPPFPLNAQYVSAIMAAKKGAGEDDSEDENTGKPPKKIKKPKKPKNKGASKQPVKSKESGWNYNSIRTNFINGLKSDGKSFGEASKLWDESMDKAKILSSISVAELKKRRFLPAGSVKNPWHEKVHGPTN